jgi:hypothetical protein
MKKLFTILVLTIVLLVGKTRTHALKLISPYCAAIEVCRGILTSFSETLIHNVHIILLYTKCFSTIVPEKPRYFATNLYFLVNSITLNQLK